MAESEQVTSILLALQVSNLRKTETELKFVSMLIWPSYRRDHNRRRPLAIRDTSKPIGEVISWLKSIPRNYWVEDTAIDYDAVLIWGEKPRFITGVDIPLT